MIELIAITDFKWVVGNYYWIIPTKTNKQEKKTGKRRKEVGSLILLFIKVAHHKFSKTYLSQEGKNRVVLNDRTFTASQHTDPEEGINILVGLW